MDILNVQARTHGRVLVRRAAGPAGVLVGYHGYGESAELHMERLASLGGADAWTLVSVQALHRFYQGKTEEVVACWMTWQDRELAIADNIRYVDALLDQVHPDPTMPLVHLGFSQGVATAYRAAVRGHRRGTAVVAVGGDVPPELLQEPHVVFPDVLILRGERDEWYTLDKFEEDVEALGRHHARLEARQYAGAHEWNAAVADATAAFLASRTPDLKGTR